MLAPNGRPVQVTDDLASFWRTTYAEVRRQLRGPLSETRLARGAARRNAVGGPEALAAPRPIGVSAKRPSKTAALPADAPLDAVVAPREKRRREDRTMTKRTIDRGWQVALVAGVFAAGFLSGSLAQRNAEAQLGEMGGKVMEKAGEQGGALGSVAKMGTAIGEMQQHLDGLQKNLETFKQVKAALGQ